MSRTHHSRSSSGILPPQESAQTVPELSSIASFRHFYLHILEALRRSGSRFLIGGSYALAAYTEIARTTKDIDLFVTPEEFGGIMAALSQAGYETERTFPHWLGKVRLGEFFVDVIFSSGNGLCDVDEDWFIHASHWKLDEHVVELVPPEEMIWTKAFVMERERYDGTDIIHLIHACWKQIDWQRLIRRFGTYWEVLFSHLQLFAFVYPEERHKVPQWVWQTLMKRLEQRLMTPPSSIEKRLCRGPLISWNQFMVPIQSWGYKDARLMPLGNLNQKHIAEFTETMHHETLLNSQWWVKS